MQTLAIGYRGLSYLIDLNRDRLLALVVIAAALIIGSNLGTI